MCFGSPRTPTVVKTDPVAEQRKAEEEARIKGYESSTARSRRRRQTALMTEGASTSALQTYGQQTLGNGL